MPKKIYHFKIVLEPDDDFDGYPAGWHSYCRALEHQGASTWGRTEAEALNNIEIVHHMVVAKQALRENLTERPSFMPSSPTAGS